MPDWSKLAPFSLPPGWNTADRLQLLQGSAVNALVVPRVDELSGEFRSACEARKLAVVDFGQLRRSTLARMPVADAVVVQGSVWPRVRGFNEAGAAAAGPTGTPWVDSNGWLIGVARAKAGAKAVWLAHEAPQGRALRTADYQLAVADAMTWGGRWVISLDSALSDGMAKKNDAALAKWAAMNDAVRWFREHAPVPELLATPRLAVVSKFESPVTNEAVNLLARRFVGVRAIVPEALNAGSLDGIRAVYCDFLPIPEILSAFAGLLITSEQEAGLITASVTPRFGRQGKRAIANGRIADPYLLATDIHLLLTRAADQVRLWNSSTMSVNYRENRDGSKARLDLVNYATGSGNDVSLQTLAPFGKARFVTPGKAPIELEVRKGFAGAEVALPAFGVFGYLEFWDRRLA